MPVAGHASRLGLDVWSPADLGAPETLAGFAETEADAGVVAAYGALIPVSVFRTPRLGCVNIHPSLLPRWRGAAPVQRALLDGDTETAVCIIRMERRLDSGPVLMRRRTEIAPDETSGDLERRLSYIGAELCADCLARLDHLEPEPQAEDGASYANKVEKRESRIDWTRPAVEVDRLIRGLSPSPGAWGDLSGERIKFLRSGVSRENGRPGEILDHSMTVACGDGAVRILEAQRPGKKTMTASEMMRGFKNPVGKRMALD